MVWVGSVFGFGREGVSICKVVIIVIGFIKDVFW